MRITEEIEKCKQLVGFDKEMIIHQIYESWKRIDNNEGTAEDRFIVGLRYPEFLAKDSSNDDELMGAYRRANIYRGKIGVTMSYLMEGLKNIYGLK